MSADVRGARVDVTGAEWHGLGMLDFKKNPKLFWMLLSVLAMGWLVVGLIWWLSSDAPRRAGAISTPDRPDLARHSCPPPPGRAPQLSDFMLVDGPCPSEPPPPPAADKDLSAVCRYVSWGDAYSAKGYHELSDGDYGCSTPYHVGNGQNTLAYYVTGSVRAVHRMKISASLYFSNSLGQDRQLLLISADELFRRAGCGDKLPAPFASALKAERNFRAQTPCGAVYVAVDRWPTGLGRSVDFVVDPKL